MERMPLLPERVQKCDLQGSVNLPPDDNHQKRRWPVCFWFILKILSLYYHDTVVTKRRCYLCNVKRSIDERSFSKKGGRHSHFENLDYLMLTYEYANIAPEKIDDLNFLEEERCETCDFLWWNGDGEPDIYNEEEIGVKHWNHKGSGKLSVAVLLLAITVLLYNCIVPIAELWENSEQVLHLILKMALIIALSIAPVMSLCSKLRSYFHFGVTNKFDWATVLNVRYLISRGQLLNLPQRGLPGIPFFVFCLCGPVLVNVYRSMVYLYFGECPLTLYPVITSVVGIFFSEYFSLIIYLLYMIRVSFQRQLNLLLAYIKENEDDVRRCKGILLATASDFACFREFCDVVTALMLPIFVLAIAANTTWSYLMASDSCIVSDERVYSIETHISILIWSEICFSLTLYLLAIGGFSASYIWDKFFVNLLHLRDDDYLDFWRDVLRNMERIVAGSQALMASVVFSVIGLYAGFQFNRQNTAFLAPGCNLNYTQGHYCG